MFNFGGGGGGGFQFGAATTSNNAGTSNTTGFQAPQAAGGFSFGTPSTQASTFGAPNAFATNTAANSTPQFSFGSSVQQPQQQQQVQQQSALNFSFNTPSTTTNTLGSALASGSGGFSLGGTQPTTTTASSFGGFNLGGFGAVSQNSGASSGLKLGGNIGGGSTGGGGFAGFGSQNTAPSVAATPNQPSFSFGAAAIPAATTTAAAGFTLGGASSFSFGATPTTAVAAAATATTNQSLVGLLGAAPNSNPVTSTTTASIPSSGFSLGAASGASGFKLGGFGSTTSTTPAAAVTTTTAAPSGLAAFSLPSNTASSLFSGSSSISATTTTAPTAVATTTTAVTTTTATTISPTTTYAQLEEMINRWSEELQGQEKVFLEQATQVNAWDRVLHENGEKIGHLNIELEKVKLDHQRLDHDLDLILGQQTELEEVLKPLEENVAQQAATYSQQQPQHADLERENIYKLTENIDDDLKKLSVDLKDVIEHINCSGTGADSSDNVMIQISKILNSHMDSLQWIDRNTEALQRRVDEFSHQLTENHQPQSIYPQLNSLYTNSPLK